MLLNTQKSGVVQRGTRSLCSQKNWGNLEC